MKTIITAFALLCFSSLHAQILDHQDFYPSDFGVDSTIEYFGNQIANYSQQENDSLQYVIISANTYKSDTTDYIKGGLFIGGFDNFGELKFTTDLTQKIQTLLPSNIDLTVYYRYGIDSAGDLNNDGINDIVLGSPRFQSNNPLPNDHLTFVYMNENFNPDSVKVLNGIDVGFKNTDEFGYNVKNIGDWDNNGYEDLAIALPGYSKGDTIEVKDGAIALLFMDKNAQVLKTTQIENITTNINSVGWGFGTGLVANLDMNNDGIKDIIVGTPHGSEFGNVSIYYLDGDQKVLSTAVIDKTTLPTSIFEDDDHFGQAITSPGDLNNDGIPELLISMHWSESGTHHAGKLFVISLDENGNILDFAEVFNQQLEDDFLEYDDHFGRDITVLNDFNNDGFGEILASIDDDVNDTRGKLRLIYTDYDYLLGASSNLNDLAHNKISIEIYPNPSTSIMNVKSKELINQRFKIVNSLGINVMTGYLDVSKQIIVNHLPMGYYYLVLIDNEQKEYMAKFIKQ
jgi:hypothetical protein